MGLILIFFRGSDYLFLNLRTNESCQKIIIILNLIYTVLLMLIG